MVAATFYSENVTNLTSDPVSVLDRKKGRVKTLIDQRAVDASVEMNEANDMILFGPVPSNAVILDVRVMNDEIDSHACPTLEGDWGLVYSGIGGSQAEDGNTIGTELDYNLFADASAVLQNAATSWTSVRYATDDIVDADKEAWEAAGLSSDPGGLLYLSFRVGTAAATAADGDIVVRIDYI